MTMSCNCGKPTCSKCCDKTIRGPKGAQGLVGPRGATGPQGEQGPQGPAGTLNGSQVTFDAEQTIAKGALTPITGATRSLLEGDYMVWGEFDLYNLAVDSRAQYGIYLDGVLQNDYRLLGTTDGSGLVIHQYHKAVVNGIVSVTGTQTLTLQLQSIEGTVAVQRGSILYQKIS